jgi:Vault protein inter-alpha-trypsin domain
LKSITLLRGLAGVILLVLAAVPASGRRVFYAPKRACPLVLRRVDVLVENGLARTTLRLGVHDPQVSKKRMVFNLPLPADATVVGLTHETGNERFEGLLVEKGLAQKILAESTERRRGPVLAERVDPTRLRFITHSAASGPQTVIEVSYVQPAPSCGGAYVLPLKGADTFPLLAADAKFAMRIVAPGPIHGVLSSLPRLITKRRSPRELEIRSHEIPRYPARDIRVHWCAEVAEPTLEVETFKPADGPGIFLASVTMPAGDAGKEPALLDLRIAVSGVEVLSMRPSHHEIVHSGERAIVIGRYGDGGEVKVTAMGTVAGEPTSLMVKTTFREHPGGPISVRHLHAIREIARLTAALGGDPEEERIFEILDLSFASGVQSARTAYLLVSSEDRARIDPHDQTAVRVAAASTARALTTDREPPMPDPPPIDLALRWLAGQQEDDGRFRGTAALGDPAATGLSLLAFLSAGETHKTGRHKITVKTGLRYLKSIQDDDGCYGPRDRPGWLRDHAWAAFAMTEAYALTGSPLFKQSAQDAVKFIEKAREPGCGWGEKPGATSRTSVTVPMILVLKSAKVTGVLQVEAAVFAEVRAWLDTVTDADSGRVSERPGESPDQADPWLTPAAILTRVLCGEDPRTSAIIRKGNARCLEHLPVRDRMDARLWFCGTRASWLSGNDVWRKWWPALRAAAVHRQCGDGADTGSWSPAASDEGDLGRTGTTALATLDLAILWAYRGASHRWW